MDRVCRYIDDYHLLVDKNLFHICEFVEKIKENNYKVIPMCLNCNKSTAWRNCALDIGLNVYGKLA